ncbi:ABC transporter permease [Kaistia sp. 32K]|nr:ABC transporter permease [Kaistia sp. 32K]
MLAPVLLLCGVFIFIPALLTVAGSFFSFGVTSPHWDFVGGANYARAATDPVFWTAMKNNIILVVGSVVLQVGLGTILAAILDRGIPTGSTFFRTIIFAPIVVSSVAVALIWLIIFDPNTGILNAIVKGMGLTPPPMGWLGDPNISIWMVLIVGTWQYTGFMMVMILAGLQAIPKELYEAAAFDGARGVKAFWYITLPGIRNVLAVAALVTTISGFKAFDLIFVLTQGGPANATQVLGTYIYFQAFKFNDMGYAYAISVVLLAVAVVLGSLQLKSNRRA